MGQLHRTSGRKNGLFAHHLVIWKTAFCAEGKAAQGTREIRVRALQVLRDVGSAGV